MPNNLLDTILSSTFNDMILDLHRIHNSFKFKSFVTFWISSTDTPLGHLFIVYDDCPMSSSRGAKEASSNPGLSGANYDTLTFILGIMLPSFSKIFIVCSLFTTLRRPLLFTSSVHAFSFVVDSIALTQLISMPFDLAMKPHTIQACIS